MPELSHAPQGHWFRASGYHGAVLSAYRDRRGSAPALSQRGSYKDDLSTEDAVNG